MNYNINFYPLDKDNKEIVLCTKSGYTYFPYDLDFIPREDEMIDFNFKECFHKI